VAGVPLPSAGWGEPGITRDPVLARRDLALDCAEDLATRGCLAGILMLSTRTINFGPLINSSKWYHAVNGGIHRAD